MRLRKLGHACLLVDTGSARVLIDPGVFSPGAGEVEGVTAILVTHQHADHLDPGLLTTLLERNPGAQVLADSASAQQLRDDVGVEATVAEVGGHFDLGVSVDVVGGQHAEIHPDMPRIPNVGYLVDGRLLHPGDALDVTDVEAEVLALPTMAPWMRMAEAIDYLRAVRPRVAVPIHDALLRSTDLYYNAFRNLGPDRARLQVLDDGEPVEL